MYLVVCLSNWVCLVFPHNQMGYGFGQNPTGVRCPSFHIRSRVPESTRLITGNVDLDHLVKVCIPAISSIHSLSSGS